MVKSLRRGRDSGALRQLPSGKWQARVRTPDGKHLSVGTFEKRADAERALVETQARKLKGAAVDPRPGRVTLNEYADLWVAERSLRPGTRELYRMLLRTHIKPRLGARPLSEISAPMVRSWRAALINHGVGASTVAKCYRLLKTILNTAVEDEAIGRNPCNIKGAGVERAAERPIATIRQVDALVAAAPDHMKALILTATYTSLRFGELSALTRRHVDLEEMIVTVVASAAEVNGKRIVGEPKSEAGRREVTIPTVIEEALRNHLDRFAQPGRTGLVFVGERGGPLRRGNFNVRWRELCAEVGIVGLRFHDLRHTGNTLAAMTGASTRELMARMGHSSARAALIYQHATRERDRAISDKLSEMVVQARA